MKLKINLNADVAEGYGKWKMGNDKDILSQINSANIACGKHAGDENIMFDTVKPVSYTHLTLPTSYAV